MGYRRRIYFREKQKAEIWDRWQRGEPISSIGRRFDRNSAAPLLGEPSSQYRVPPNGVRPKVLARMRHTLEAAAKASFHGCRRLTLVPGLYSRK